MARIRSLKPEFWTDSAVVQCSPLARLLFQGVWNFADDCGVIEDDPMQLKLQILPADPVNVEELVDELVKTQLLLRACATDGTRVLVVRSWDRHQVINRPSGPRHGHPSEFTYDNPLSPAETPPLTERSVSAHAGVEGKGEEGRGVEGARAGAPDPPAEPAARKPRARAIPLPESWTPNDGHHELARAERVDLAREAAKFRDHHLAKGSMFKDWDRAFSNWLRRSAEFQARASPRGAGSLPPEPSTSDRHDPKAWT